jgi:hypothetical protein
MKNKEKEHIRRGLRSIMPKLASISDNTLKDALEASRMLNDKDAHRKISKECAKRAAASGEPSLYRRTKPAI